MVAVGICDVSLAAIRYAMMLMIHSGHKNNDYSKFYYFHYLEPVSLSYTRSKYLTEVSTFLLKIIA